MPTRRAVQGLLSSILAVSVIAGCGGGSGSTSSVNQGGSAQQPTSSSLPSGLSFISAPAGSFTMGTVTRARQATDATAHQVTLSAFWLSEKEVTNGQYVEFLNAAAQAGEVFVQRTNFEDPCGVSSALAVSGAGAAKYSGFVYVELSERSGCTSNGEAESDLNRSWITYDETTGVFSVKDNGDGVDRSRWPVTWVKWYGAAAFAEFYGLALPTEAQWEYTARSGSDSTTYPTSTGDIDQSLANYNGTEPNVLNPTGHVVSVGSYPPNPWGFYDMGGNVWEWCQDYYAADFYTTNTDNTDPINTQATDQRVKRGGSWNFHAATLTTYARNSDMPDRGNNHFGFRVAASTQP